MGAAEELLESKGVRWIFNNSNSEQEINKAIDWKRINEIIERPILTAEQKKEEMGDYFLHLLFSEKGRMEIVDFPLFMTCYNVPKKNLDIFKKEMKYKIKFQYRTQTKKMLGERTKIFRTENIEYLPISEQHKKEVEELDKKYQFERVFNDNFQPFEEAIKRINERFKKTIFDIRKVDLRQTGYECIVAMSEELNKSVSSLK